MTDLWMWMKFPGYESCLLTDFIFTLSTGVMIIFCLIWLFVLNKTLQITIQSVILSVFLNNKVSTPCKKMYRKTCSLQKFWNPYQKKVLVGNFPTKNSKLVQTLQYYFDLILVLCQDFIVDLKNAFMWLVPRKI